MTSSIRTICHDADCGEVQLGVRAVTLSVDPLSRSGAYAFYCPNCGRRNVRPADERVVGLLVLGGVQPQPTDAGTQPPFTQDDLLAFAELLANDDWLKRLLENECD